jgi:hypothetical protein
MYKKYNCILAIYRMSSGGSVFCRLAEWPGISKSDSSADKRKLQA